MNNRYPHNTNISRIDMKEIRRAILSLFNLEKGLTHTIVELIKNPGAAIHNFLFEDRTKLVKPLGFLMLCVTVGTFMTLTFTNFNDVMSQGMELSGGGEGIPPEIGNIFMEYMTSYYSVFQLMAVPFMAITSFFFFKKHQYNFPEHLVLNSYLAGLNAILYILIIPVMNKDYLWGNLSYLVITLGVTMYFYHNIFKDKIVQSIWRTTLAYIIYYGFFILIMTIMVMILTTIQVVRNSELFDLIKQGSQ